MIESSFFTSLIGFFIVLTPLVFFHELGHYYAAIKSGVKVESFSIGFGPEIFGFTDKKNTRWKFSLIPLGGYVKMKGELINVSKKTIKSSIEKDTFLHANLFSRYFIPSTDILICSNNDNRFIFLFSSNLLKLKLSDE